MYAIVTTVVVHQDGSDVNQLGLALIGAAFGAVLGGSLTISGDICLRSWSERRKFEQLLRTLTFEIDLIVEEATRRDALYTKDIVRVQSPLPVQCWELFLSAGVSSHLGIERSAHIANFYMLVQRVNYLTGLIPMMVSVSVSEDSALGRSFLEQARQFGSVPLGELLELSEKALVAAGRDS